jgi:hypothetical protein
MGQAPQSQYPWLRHWPFVIIKFFRNKPRPHFTGKGGDGRVRRGTRELGNAWREGGNSFEKGKDQNR